MQSVNNSNIHKVDDSCAVSLAKYNNCVNKDCNNFCIICLDQNCSFQQLFCNIDFMFIEFLSQNQI